MTVAACPQAVPPLPPLSSNGYALDDAPGRIGRMTPTAASASVDAARAVYEAQGYVWLKGLLPPEDVWAFRERFFAEQLATGLIDPEAGPRAAVYAGAEDRGAAAARQVAMARSPEFDALCRHPALTGFIEAFIGGAAHLHQRRIVRYTRPGDPVATGAHYDRVYLREGTARFVTAWLPLGDTPVEMGGICYLEGSHRIGLAEEERFAELAPTLPPEERALAYHRHAGPNAWLGKNLAQIADRYDRRWLVADYEAATSCCTAAS